MSCYIFSYLDITSIIFTQEVFIFPVKERITQKLWQLFKVLWAFFESGMVSMIRTLNKISKDYRYVVRVLAQEKREVKVNYFLNIRFFLFSAFFFVRISWNFIYVIRMTKRSFQNFESCKNSEFSRRF